MELRVYRKTSLSLTDISDDILSMTGLETRRDWNYRGVVSRLNITVPKDLSIDVGDKIYIKIDGEYKLIYYVEKIKTDYQNNTKSIEAPEIIYKLKDFYIGDIEESDWSGWYSPNNTEYKNVHAGNSTYWNEQYIQIKFLISVIIHKTGLMQEIYSNANNGYFYRITDCNSGNTTHNIGLHNLGFCLPQMKMIGKQKKDDANIKGSTLLDVFLKIMNVVNLGWDYHVESTNGLIYLHIYNLVNHANPTISNDARYSYSEEEKKQYNAFKSSLVYYSTIDDYYGSSTPTSETTEEVIYPTISGDDVGNIKTFSILNHFQLYHIDESSYKIYQFGYCSQGKSMLRQWIERNWALYSAFSSVKKIKTYWQYNTSILKNRINVKDRISDIVIYE